ncbi:hypothetical protein ACWKSP_35035 [Micromonosporaceae bacterium Da 78-11]
MEDFFAEAAHDDLVLLHFSGHGLKSRPDRRRGRRRCARVRAGWNSARWPWAGGPAGTVPS